MSFVLIMAGVLSAGALQAQAADKDGLKIVTTIFPEYDWVMNLLGENPAGASVTMLLDSGIDLHSYQPTVEDIMEISNCDLLIYVGGESEAWVKDALQEAVNPDMAVISLLEALGDKAKEEEIVEGMEGEAEEDPELDEHVWLSLRNASFLCENIEKTLETLDTDNAELYQSNLTVYTEKLAALDQKYETVVAEGSRDTLLFGDRFPFRYLTDDYGLSYYAAFVGCSAETEASFETIAFLAQKVDELSLKTVMTLEGSDRRIAETIVESTKNKDQQILSLDSLQSITAKDVEEGASYLSVMESNLETLKEALE